MKRFLILFYFSFTVNTSLQHYNTMQVKNLTISKCDKINNYPVEVTNVTVQLGTHPKVKVSGSLSSQVDLVGPVKASVSLKRDIWGVWIPMPCEDKVGSCTYEDLCDYGYPTNTSCPKVYQENDVPCRCPIKKGNYTISPSVEVSQPTSVISGTYKGTITITQDEIFLSCYNVHFVLYDDNDLNSVVQV